MGGQEKKYNPMLFSVIISNWDKTLLKYHLDSLR